MVTSRYPIARGPVGVQTVILGSELIDESERYAAELLALGDTPIRGRDIKDHRENGFQNRKPSRHDDVTILDRIVSVGAQSVALRQFLPLTPPRGAYLHFHGGGWVFGAANMYDDELADLSHDLGIAVFSVEYRLAPEHPFPAPLDDAETAARWFIGEGSREFSLHRAVIGGWSAGAHLVATTLQRLALTGDAEAFCAANLLYGIFDLSMSPSQRAARETPRLSREDLEWYYEMATPSLTLEERRSESISPLYGDFGAMPPARFAVGTLDPLFDDSTFMAERWAGAGSPATLEVYLAGAHGFARQPNGLGVLARQREADFLALHLGAD